MKQQNTNKKQKNILIKIGMIALFILLMIGISGGMSSIIYNSKNVPASSTIENGMSAYEIAVQYGYDGSVQDWLDSLNGKSAYDIAVENGYSGTETEWATALKAAANSNNVTIKTASFSASGELIITLSDGTQLNLGKAVGADGKDGKDGKDGHNGTNGVNGVNGKDGVSISSANINSVGQLVLSFSDGSTINLDKVVGMNGADGVGVTKSEINENGELVLTYSNGQKCTLGSVIGATGKDGRDGIDGVDGKDGLNGSDGHDGADGTNGIDGKDGISITNAAVDAHGELVLTYSDGTTSNLGTVVGKDGQNGINGVDGTDGIGVINAEITSDGELVLTYSNGQRSNLGNVIGATGRDGIDGKEGEDGRDGIDGISVVKSEINSRGELILTYSNGNINNLGVVVGANGKDGRDGNDGKDGENGKDGKDGTDGEDGVGIDNIVINADGQLEIILTNGTSMNLGTIKGTDGQNGRDGQDGKDGENGKDGQNGTDGTDGEDGVGIAEATINSSGELVLSYSNGESVNLGKIVGSDGKDGENGKDGIDGTNGADGEDGISITNAKVNSEGELVITYSDGNSDNLGRIVGRDGVDGKDGQNGRDGIDGKDGIGITEVSINDGGELELIFSDLSSINLGNIVGRDGKDGKDGENGKDGQNGIDGKDGQDGKNGQDGVGIKNVKIIEGELSVELTSGTIINLGNINGENGIGILKSEINENGELVLTYTDGETANLGRVVGQDGVGGQNGADGKDGTNGTDGKDGVGIKSVSVAEDGQLVVILTNDSVLVAGNVKGEKGDDGLSAYEIALKYGKTTAETEEKWLQELKGEKGDTGSKGADGEQGAQGAQGEKGADGKDGEDGRGIDRMEIIDGELIIYYTDGSDDNLGSIKAGSSEIWSEEEDETTGLIFVLLPNGTYGVKVGSAASNTSITIPGQYKEKAVTVILEHGFDGCPNLTSISIPNSVVDIRDYAFSECRNLGNTTLPEHLEKIGRYAFYRCESMTEVTFPQKTTFIGAFAYYKTSLTSATFTGGNEWSAGGDNFEWLQVNSATVGSTTKYLLNTPEKVATALTSSVSTTVVVVPGRSAAVKRNWYAEDWVYTGE